MAPEAPRRVVIAGGGVAALEAALALHDLAGERVALTIVAPDTQFTYRPLSVKEPFALGRAKSIPLADVARDLGATLVSGAVASVDAPAREVTLTDGERVPWDALLVAVGARRVPVFEHATTFRGQEDAEPVHGLIQDVESGYVRSVVFVVPPGPVWPLPLYELALMTAERAREMSIAGVELTVVTPEEQPLAAFGPAAATAVRELLERSGVRVMTSARAEVPAAGRVTAGAEELSCDRVVALPRLEPIALDGLPGDSGGFTPVDAGGRVHGLPGVYAAGDGTAFPVKQGGLACQQADAAAASIAREAGADVPAQPFEPVLRGQLLTGGSPLYLRGDIGGTSGERSESSGHTLWWPPTKVAGDYLAPYLDGRAAAGPGAPLPHKRRLAHAAGRGEPGHGIDLLGFDTPGDGA